jgi:hypothetical protein
MIPVRMKRGADALVDDLLLAVHAVGVDLQQDGDPVTEPTRHLCDWDPAFNHREAVP